MEETRDLIKTIRDTKGIFHAKMGSIKYRNGMYLTKAEDIKKRSQEYTELYKEDLNDRDNHDGVITHLEADIVEGNFKWALGSITTNIDSGGDEIPVELWHFSHMYTERTAFSQGQSPSLRTSSFQSEAPRKRSLCRKEVGWLVTSSEQLWG